MKLRYAMVCASNQNRSMEAHALLQREGLDVSSYGTGTQVKLPGPTIRDPNVYQFGTPYTAIIEDLKKKDPDLYKRNGLLPMLKRNASVKDAPQRWQDNAGDGAFDVVLTFEERVFDIVNEDLQNREQTLFKTVLVVNLDVKDNHEEAAIGAKLALDLCKRVKEHSLSSLTFSLFSSFSLIKVLCGLPASLVCCANSPENKAIHTSPRRKLPLREKNIHLNRAGGRVAFSRKRWTVTRQAGGFALNLIKRRRQ